MTKSKEDHMEAIKKYAFRGKIEEEDFIHRVVLIKVSSIISKILLQDHFKEHGIANVTYKIQLLKWYECWVPRYQVGG